MISEILQNQTLSLLKAAGTAQGTYGNLSVIGVTRLGEEEQ
jgi:hypothetical protein